MGNLSKRSTVYFDPDIHQALKVKAASTDSSLSEIVDEAVRLLMLEDQDKIARNLLAKLSEYAMGRQLNYADSDMIHRLLEASRKNDYKLRDLMVSIIADESFTKR